MHASNLQLEANLISRMERMAVAKGLPLLLL